MKKELENPNQQIKTNQLKQQKTTNKTQKNPSQETSQKKKKSHNLWNNLLTTKFLEGIFKMCLISWR